MKKQRIIGLCAVLLGIAVAIYTTTIRVRVELTEPGPKLFPMIAGIGIAVCGAGIFLTAPREEKSKPFLDVIGWKRYWLSMLILLLYTVGLYLFGFIAASPFCVLALSRLFSEKKYNWGVGVIVSVITTAAIYYIFTVAFKLALPVGLIWG